MFSTSPTRWRLRNDFSQECILPTSMLPTWWVAGRTKFALKAAGCNLAPMKDRSHCRVVLGANTSAYRGIKSSGAAYHSVSPLSLTSLRDVSRARAPLHARHTSGSSALTSSDPVPTGGQSIIRSSLAPGGLPGMTASTYNLFRHLSR